jgi:hypothetical protein
LAKEINASLIIAVSMFTLDIAMPLALFGVIVVALFLNKRTEGRLMSTVEEKQFKTKDVVVLVAFMAIIISGLALAAIYTPGELFSDVILVFFLFSYTMLLFTISYLFSGIPKVRAQLLSVGFGVASIIAGAACALPSLQDAFTILRVAAFMGLAAFCFGVAFYERKNTVHKERWYVAAQPPAIFVLLFVFFNFLNNAGTAAIWAPYLMDVFGLTFAVLIILYLSTLFNWKTVGLFAVLLTAMDIILVIGSTAMITAANSFSGLGLPVLVQLPNIPLTKVLNTDTNTLVTLYHGLGLGDFFFAGILTVQTYKRFGQQTAIIAAGVIAIVFGIWDAYLLDIVHWISSIVGRNIGGMPATVFIITGWAPVIAVALWLERRKKANLPAATPTVEPAQEPSVPVQ